MKALTERNWASDSKQSLALCENKQRVQGFQLRTHGNVYPSNGTRKSIVRVSSDWKAHPIEGIVAASHKHYNLYVRVET